MVAWFARAPSLVAWMDHEFDNGHALLSQAERARLLADAAARLDRRASKLGPGGEPRETEQGRLVRMFAEDKAEVGRPEILPLPAAALVSPAVEAPDLTRSESHFWLAFPVSLWTRASRGFNRIEFKVSFNPGEQDDSRRPTTVDALPDHELVTRFESSAELSLAIGADFKFRAGLPDVPLGLPATLAANADAQVEARAKLVLSPKKYVIRAARVTRSGLGLGYVFWRLERDAFAEENDPGLRVILRVPAGTERLDVSVEMVARRYASMFGAGLREGIRDLPAAMRDFFTRGTPILATGGWDLSSVLC
jgi:hypothetical protein